MSKEFERWWDNQVWQAKVGIHSNIVAEMAWNAARDKILQLIEENTDSGYYEAPGGRIGFDTKFIDWNSLIKLKEEIEKL